MKNLSFIVLAAGVGKRMKSSLSKVMHEIAGEPMVLRTAKILENVGPKQIIIVVNPQNSQEVKDALGEKYLYATQPSPLGTADATLTGLSIVDSDVATVSVLYGDNTAFYKPQTIKKVFEKHQKSKAMITFVTLEKEDPTGFGRIIRKNGEVVDIIEEKDAGQDQKNIKEINDGLYFFDKNWLSENLQKLKPSLATGELYLTDLIKVAIKSQDKVQTFELKDPNEWHSINTPEELALANQKIRSSTPGVECEKFIHIMGAAGSGSSAVANIAKVYGYKVTACDLNPVSSYTKNLENLKIEKGHSPSHIKGIDQLIVTEAILKLDPENPEIKEAQKNKIPILIWEKFQADFLQKDKFVIAVAGAYGKSTTTAMISKILEDQNLDPTCEIGATLLDWGKNFRIGKSKYYVCEVDEYYEKFLNYKPDVAVVLSLGWDHPDYFRTEKDLVASYKKFINKIKVGGTLIVPQIDAIAAFQQDIRKDIKIVKISDFSGYKLSIIGDFRKENAQAALSVAEVLGLDLEKAQKTLQNFKGIGRRLEYKGEVNGVMVYDDYAVQPYTVLKTSNALKEKFPHKKITLVFEPHTFSRIQTFFDQFVSTLKNSKVDEILITEVYPAREKGDRKKLSEELAKAVGPKAQFSGSIEETAAHIKANLKNHQLILSMGAGDVYKIYDLISS